LKQERWEHKNAAAKANFESILLEKDYDRKVLMANGEYIQAQIDELNAKAKKEGREASHKEIVQQAMTNIKNEGLELAKKEHQTAEEVEQIKRAAEISKQEDAYNQMFLFRWGRYLWKGVKGMAKDAAEVADDVADAAVKGAKAYALVAETTGSSLGKGVGSAINSALGGGGAGSKAPEPVPTVPVPVGNDGTKLEVNV
jgi:archaellum component FlaD/FlaE